MKKNAIIYINDTQAQVTKAFEKQARIFGTEQYNLWKAYRQDFPDAKMVTKTIKKNPNKKTYKNLTYANMKIYIMAQSNDEKVQKKLLAEFKRAQDDAVVESNPYRTVLAWFLKKYDEKKYQEFFKSEDEAESEATKDSVSVVEDAENEVAEFSLPMAVNQ